MQNQLQPEVNGRTVIARAISGGGRTGVQLSFSPHRYAQNRLRNRHGLTNRAAHN
jgi:hypothetical protein